MEGWPNPADGFDAAHARATLYGSGDQLVSRISTFIMVL
jgi:hypothetical protein